MYPGLGSFRGVLKWSQGGRVAESEMLYKQEFGGIRNTIADARLETLQAEPKFMASAKRIYDRNCAVCHGYDAAGQASLFPNLVDDVWQWGGSPEEIEQTLRDGRNAVMVGWAGPLGADGVREVADYIKVMGDDRGAGHPGQIKYNQFCVACHGASGEGTPALGAPNLADDTWLYGSSDEDVIETITNGRTGVMPDFGGRLDDTQIRLLVAWLTREAD